MFRTWSVTLQCNVYLSDGQVRSTATLLPDTIYSAPLIPSPSNTPVESQILNGTFSIQLTVNLNKSKTTGRFVFQRSFRYAHVRDG